MCFKCLKVYSNFVKRADGAEGKKGSKQEENNPNKDPIVIQNKTVALQMKRRRYSKTKNWAKFL